MARVKNINSLMKYLRDEHNIKIDGTRHKQKLKNIGYYHGFKGYRFIKTPSQRIVFNSFDELLSIYEFDMNLKSLFYPQLMFTETALKNHVLEVILKHCKVECYDTIFEGYLTNYKTYDTGSNNYKDAIKKRLRLRNKVYNALTRSYANNKQVVQHFYHKDKPAPIWAIFEIISLGEFGDFVSCANSEIKRDISKSLNLNQSYDPNGQLSESIIYVVKDLRNAVAHNDVIFDTRFKSSSIRKPLGKSIETDTNVNNITFETIIDYLILLLYIQKKLKKTKTELKKIYKEFEQEIERFRKQVPINIYNKIFYTDTRNKLQKLKEYLSL